MNESPGPSQEDLLSPDEEEILAVLRGIAASMRECGVPVTLESFGSAVIAAGAARTTGADGSEHSAYALCGVRFQARAVGGASAVEVSFLPTAP
jgi:hypothetical protein